MRLETFDLSLTVEAIFYFKIFFVLVIFIKVVSKQLIASRSLEKAAARVYIRVPILLHDAVHNFGVHQCKRVHQFHVVQ